MLDAQHTGTHSTPEHGGSDASIEQSQQPGPVVGVRTHLRQRAEQSTAGWLSGDQLSIRARTLSTLAGSNAETSQGTGWVACRASRLLMTCGGPGRA